MPHYKEVTRTNLIKGFQRAQDDPGTTIPIGYRQVRSVVFAGQQSDFSLEDNKIINPDDCYMGIINISCQRPEKSKNLQYSCKISGRLIQGNTRSPQMADRSQLEDVIKQAFKFGQDEKLIDKKSSLSFSWDPP